MKKLREIEYLEGALRQDIPNPLISILPDLTHSGTAGTKRPEHRG